MRSQPQAVTPLRQRVWALSSGLGQQQQDTSHVGAQDQQEEARSEHHGLRNAGLTPSPLLMSLSYPLLPLTSRFCSGWERLPMAGSTNLTAKVMSWVICSIMWSSIQEGPLSL